MILVYITFPNKKSASRICDTLVREKLAACANIFPIHSIYRWKNKIEKTNEHVALVKTSEKNYEKIEKRVRALHPYELPAIFAIPVARGYGKYLRWAEESSQA
ncbi:MAG: divalent-cation tolerance protein CutA [Candidatus Micrarchaeota archaeon]